jgi:hypothetical protein
VYSNEEDNVDSIPVSISGDVCFLVSATPLDWFLAVPMDWSGGFWQRTALDYPRLRVL